MAPIERSAARPFAAPMPPIPQPSWFQQACTWEDVDRLYDALRCYQRSLEVEGQTAIGYFNLGNVHYQLRRKFEAVECFRQAVAIDPDSHDGWNNLGVVLCELNQCNEACRALQTAIARAPWFADAHYNLADCLDERGLHDQARPHWQSYLRLDSNSSWALHARARLESGQ